MNFETEHPDAFLSAAQAFVENNRRGGSWDSSTSDERREAREAVRTIVEAMRRKGVSISRRAGSLGLA